VFVAVIFLVFLVLTAAGVVLLRLGRDPAFWSAALCLLFAAFSATATWDVRDHYTGGLNVAEPLIGLGVFGAGMSASPLARRAAAALIAVHRGGLILAGTGLPSEHALLALLECGSRASAIIGSALIRAYASRLDVTEQVLTAEAASDAATSMRNTASRERNRLLHDAPVNRLWQISRNLASDSGEFRDACAHDAGLLRGARRAAGARARPDGGHGRAGQGLPRAGTASSPDPRRRRALPGGPDRGDGPQARDGAVAGQRT
jgi:hypothetical protein